MNALSNIFKDFPYRPTHQPANIKANVENNQADAVSDTFDARSPVGQHVDDRIFNNLILLHDDSVAENEQNQRIEEVLS